jgi:phosphoglycerate kinase
MKKFEDLKEYVATHSDVQRCLIRADLNLPSDIEDLTRIYAIKETVLTTLELGLAVVLISHYKRPTPEDADNPKFSLQKIADKIADVIGQNVSFHGGSVFDLDPNAIATRVTLLENLRFYEGETKNDDAFAKKLSEFGDVYINDAFSVSHRRHASVCAITNHLPAFAGLSLQNEIENLSKLTRDIKRPYTAIIGGSKIASKIEVLRKLSTVADHLVIAGAMGNTFVSATGTDLQESLIEPDQLENAKEIMESASARIILPVDVSASSNINENGRNYSIYEVPPGHAAYDIGQETANAITSTIENSKTLLWNGALGAFEFANFDASTNVISMYVAERTRNGDLISIIGGGETVASIGDYKRDVTFASTAGGAFLEFIAGYELHGLRALG